MSVSSRPRPVAFLPALLLTAGVITAASAPPASAARTTVTQDGDLALAEDVAAVQEQDIAVNDNAHATPYPSTVAVDQPGIVSDVDVTLYHVNHFFSDDLDILLVAPGGQQVVLMSDVGGSSNLTDLTYSFSDTAPSMMSDGAFNPSTGYRPTNIGAGDPFPAPAPAGPVSTTLAAFAGSPARGTWSLYVLDDEASQFGSIGAWELSIEMVSDPYPSTITVSNMPTPTDVDVTLTGITSVRPDDADIRLVGPGGQDATLMSDALGGAGLSGATFTFDDEAAGPLPDDAVPPTSGGTYRPTNWDAAADPFPAPAPGSLGPSSLSVFDGVNPNGQWQLYSVDDTSGGLTRLDGWSLHFTWPDTTAPGGSVKVNGGQSATASKTVALELSSVDPAPASGVARMRFSNDGSTYSAYQPYAASAVWTLSSGDGIKTVYAQFRDADGNESVVVSDTITLDTLSPRAKRVIPPRNAKRVALGAKVKVKASEHLLGSTVTKKTVFLKKRGTPGKVKTKLAFNAATLVIVLTPKSRLEPDSTYAVTVRGVTDTAGNRWDQKPKKSGAQSLRFSFTTA